MGTGSRHRSWGELKYGKVEESRTDEILINISTIYQDIRIDRSLELGNDDAVEGGELMQIDANDEPGSINGGNQTLGKWTESSRQSPVSRDKDCDHVDDTEKLYNRTRRPDWDEIETQEKQRTTWGRDRGWGSGRVAREGGGARVDERYGHDKRDMRTRSWCVL